MKRFWTILALILLCTSCGNLKKIAVSDFTIDSFVPASLRSVNVRASLTVDNPAKDISIYYLDGVLVKKGRQIGTVTVDPVTVKGRSCERYPLTGKVALADGVSVLEVLAMTQNFAPSEYTLDVCATVKLKGFSKIKLYRKGIPMTDLMKN